MLSYQHIYHAGCIADVQKHMVQVAVLRALLAEGGDVTYMETHAGRGVYDLSSPEARKTGEARDGILRLLKDRKLAADHPYLSLISKTRGIFGESSYPGSPLLARFLLADHLKQGKGEMHLHDLHPQEFRALQENVHGKNIYLRKENGYVGTMRHSPPKRGGKGLVLIDPSYEIKSEYEEAAYFVLDLHERWPEAVILLWYPMLKNFLFEDLADYLGDAGLPGYLHHAVRFADPEDVRGMFGSGMIAVNLPKGLDAELKLISGLLNV
ncbi:MAG: 23S rRNA (adenine(2030)-N(6))-methyltransferase RlmJ [Alphaproteobacteria bacterium]|nr:23S rRNA (adenine(2030)-N(6))-methyltransferase RlmJ [Alphaproteobacteria bacterium]